MGEWGSDPSAGAHARTAWAQLGVEAGWALPDDVTLFCAVDGAWRGKGLGIAGIGRVGLAAAF